MTSALSSEIVAALKAVLKDDELLPQGTAGYDESNGSYFSAFENELKPAYIVKPRDVRQVKAFMTALKPHLESGACSVAVRGGGHTPFAGSANVTGGITIDLRGLQGVSLSEDKSTVDIAVGETWQNVYSVLKEHRLTTAGARMARIGIPGFILGGGLSMFSTKRGFACDSVVEFETVLASGEIVRANAKEHSDLWTALKGGLNNFGIVTSIKMEAFPSTDIWGGVTIYMPDAFPTLLQRVHDFAHNETDENTHIMCSNTFSHGHQIGSCVMYHTEGKVNPPSLQRFTSLQPQIEQYGTRRSATNLEFAEELSQFSPSGLRVCWASLTIKADLALMKALSAQSNETLASVKDVEGLMFVFGYQPLTKGLLENSAKAGGNAMNIPASDGPFFIVMIQATWAKTSDDERLFKAVDDLVVKLKGLASEGDLLHRYKFTNYAYYKDDVIAGYGEQSVAKLWEVSKKYDPAGVFQRGVPGGFKLPRL